MTIAQEIFERKTFVPAKLTGYGFVPCPQGYAYSRDILGGQMRVEVTVDAQGAVHAKVVDAATDEEYAPVNVEMSMGAFVGEVREAYRNVLAEVAAACCRGEYFASPQANRIAAALHERYGDVPDFPFATAPTYGVFRYPKTRKWYALIMDVPRFRVTKEHVEHPDEAPKADVLNLKIEEGRLAELLQIKGVYRCYHMNHDSWVSVLLDDTVPDEVVLSLLDTSRALIVHGGKKKK